MKTHADKTRKKESQTGLSSFSENKTSQDSTVQFSDHSTEAARNRTLQAMANGSPQAIQQKSYADMADNSLQNQHAIQMKAMANNLSAEPVQKKENKTGLPDKLKTGVENLSGVSLNDVKVHRNSDKPAQLNAHAYAKGSNIHLGPGQQRHLPHETWHVAQQKQGRVKPTKQVNQNVNVNDDKGLEKEADVMGAKAKHYSKDDGNIIQNVTNNSKVVQKTKWPKLETIKNKLFPTKVKALMENEAKPEYSAVGRPLPQNARVVEEQVQEPKTTKVKDSLDPSRVNTQHEELLGKNLAPLTTGQSLMNELEPKGEDLQEPQSNESSLPSQGNAEGNLEKSRLEQAAAFVERAHARVEPGTKQQQKRMDEEGMEANKMIASLHIKHREEIAKLPVKGWDKLTKEQKIALSKTFEAREVGEKWAIDLLEEIEQKGIGLEQFKFLVDKAVDKLSRLLNALDSGAVSSDEAAGIAFTELLKETAPELLAEIPKEMLSELAPIIGPVLTVILELKSAKSHQNKSAIFAAALKSKKIDPASDLHQDIFNLKEKEKAERNVKLASAGGRTTGLVAGMGAPGVPAIAAMSARLFAKIKQRDTLQAGDTTEDSFKAKNRVMMPGTDKTKEALKDKDLEDFDQIQEEHVRAALENMFSDPKVLQKYQAWGKGGNFTIPKKIPLIGGHVIEDWETRKEKKALKKHEKEIGFLAEGWSRKLKRLIDKFKSSSNPPKLNNEPNLEVEEL